MTRAGNGQGFSFDAVPQRVLARLAQRLAHDFNNDLTIVLGNLQLLERNSSDQLQRRLDHMRQTADRGQRRTRLVLELMGGAHESLTDLSHDAFVELVEDLLDLLVPRRVDVQRTLALPPGTLEIDRGALAVACATLIHDAASACEDAASMRAALAPDARGAIELILEPGARDVRQRPRQLVNGDGSMSMRCSDDGRHLRFVLHLPSSPLTTGRHQADHRISVTTD